MSTKQTKRPRRLTARLGSLLAAALCIGSLAVFSPSASAASQNSGITSGKVYRIINLGSGKYLNVTGGRDQDNINVNQYTGDGTNTQDFIIRWVSAESCYKIYPICSSNGSGRVLHIARSGSALSSGGNAVIKTASSADNVSQRFQIDTVGHNLFYIRPTSKNSLYLTANGNGNGTWTGTGANTAGNVVAKTKSTGNNDDKRHQMWIIVEKTSTPYYTAQFPFADHKNGTYYTKTGNACSNHNACISFFGGSQCVAFSREIYARSFNGFRWSIDNKTDSGITNYGTSNSALKTYIKTKVGYGGHIRVSQKGSATEHSIIVTDFNDSSIMVYDANHNGTCVVRHAWLTYEKFANLYNTILYSHKGHVHTYDTYKKVNLDQHAKYCTKCSFSAYDANTLKNHTFTAASNGQKCTACNFFLRDIELTEISAPEELDTASAPETLQDPAVSKPDEPAAEESAAETNTEDDTVEPPITEEDSAAGEVSSEKAGESGAEAPAAGDMSDGDLSAEDTGMDSGPLPLTDPAPLPENK